MKRERYNRLSGRMEPTSWQAEYKLFLSWWFGRKALMLEWGFECPLWEASRERLLTEEAMVMGFLT